MRATDFYFALGMFAAGCAFAAGVTGVWGPTPLWFTAIEAANAVVAFLLAWVMSD